MDPVSGVAYTVFTAANMGGDVHAARLSGTTWTAIAPVLDDVQATTPAGRGATPARAWPSTPPATRWPPGPRRTPA